MIKIILLIVMFLYGASLPFYSGPSGGVQVADFFGLTILIFSMIGGNVIPAFKRMIWAVLCLLICFVVAVVYAIVTSSMTYVWAVVPYLYGLALCTALITLWSNDRDFVLVRAMVDGLVSGAAGVLLFGIWNGSIDLGSSRSQGFFNDPNQLSYYSLCLLVTVWHARRHCRGFSLAVCLLVCSVLCVAAGSRSGTVSYFLFLGILLYEWRLALKWKFLLLSVVLVAFVCSGTIVGNIGGVRRILQAKEEKVDYVSDRGYKRILNHSEYVVWGAGEGSVERFGENIEIHSTYLNVLFSYGMIAFVLLLMFWGEVMMKSRSLMLIVIGIQNLTQNGMRFRAFWVVIAVMVVLGGCFVPVHRNKDISC